MRSDMPTPVALPKVDIAGVGISVGSYDEHLSRFLDFARANQSSYVCCVNSHMTVEAANDQDFAEVVNGADFATADGMPITRSIRWLRGLNQDRVAGNDLMFSMLSLASRYQLNVYLYGGTSEVLQEIVDRAHRDYPGIQIVGQESPPFRPLSDEEMEETAARINGSQADVVLVSLGCPKQEKWMGRMHGKVNAIMLGVGGAFLLYAGRDTRAPKWMRDLCLEWFYRLCLEPRRLWKRYLMTNPAFVWLVAKSWFAKSNQAA